jgi:hypothetical protein
MLVGGLVAAALLGVLARDPSRAAPAPVGHGAAAAVSLLGQHKVMPVTQRRAAGRISAFRFVATASGNARAAHVYVARANRARNIIVGLYSDWAGHPRRLLATAAFAHPRPGWRAAGLARRGLRRGRTYWLAVLGSGGTLVYRTRTGRGCRNELAAQRRLRRPPARWRVGDTKAGCSLSAYITGTRAAGAPGSPTTHPPTTTGSGASPPAAGTGPVTIPAGGCFPSPGACGFPDPAAHNAGATSACSSLPSSGSITARTAGQTIANLNVNGRIIVQAPNVTINNVCVSYDGGGQLNTSAIHIEGGATNTMVEHTTVGGANDSAQSTEQALANVSGGSATAASDYVYNCGECVWGGPWTIADSYVITNGMQGTDDHLEDLYCSDESVAMTHDTLLNPADQNSVIFCDTNGGGGGACRNHITLTNSLLAGGGFVIYTCGNASSVGSSTMNISGNRFARCTTPPFRYNSGTGGTACRGATGSSIGSGADAHGYWPKGGYFGTALYTYCPPASGQTWSGNVWDDTGAEVPCHVGSP